MNRKILLTGRPGSGKTTLIKRVVNELALPAGGFYTVEICDRGKRRRAVRVSNPDRSPVGINR